MVRSSLSIVRDKSRIQCIIGHMGFVVVAGSCDSGGGRRCSSSTPEHNVSRRHPTVELVVSATCICPSMVLCFLLP